MSKKGFWWASIDGREPQVVEVGDLTTGHEVAYITGLEVEIELDGVRLIERVLPAGRAAAAVEKLQGIVSSSWHIDQATEEAMKVIDILQGEENRA